MADASTAQLLLAAAVGGLAGQALTALTRTVEFRREDRARWMRERRDAYAANLDELGAMLGESAPLASYFQTRAEWTGDANDPGIETARNHVMEIATTAYDHWVASLKHREVLRLLASKRGLTALQELDSALLLLVKSLTVTQISGVGNHTGIEQLRATAQAALERVTDIARKDIGA